MNPKVKFLTLAALLIAVGVLLPWFFTCFLLVAHVFTNAHTRFSCWFSAAMAVCRTSWHNHSTS